MCSVYVCVVCVYVFWCVVCMGRVRRACITTRIRRGVYKRMGKHDAVELAGEADNFIVVQAKRPERLSTRNMGQGLHTNHVINVRLLLHKCIRCRGKSGGDGGGIGVV